VSGWWPAGTGPGPAQPGPRLPAAARTRGWLTRRDDAAAARHHELDDLSNPAPT